MNHLAVIAALLCSGLKFTACAEPQDPTQPQQVQQMPLKIVPYGKAEVVANEVLVLFRREATALDKAAVLEALDGIVRRGFGDEHSWPRWLAIRSQSLSTAQMAGALIGHPAIQKAQPHYFLRPPGSKEADWMETEVHEGKRAVANEVFVRFVRNRGLEFRLQVLRTLDAIPVWRPDVGRSLWLIRSRTLSATELVTRLRSEFYIITVSPNFIGRPLLTPTLTTRR